MNPEMYTNNSGGAKGADLAWDRIGREFGVINHKHWRPSDLANLIPQARAHMLIDIAKAAGALGRPSFFKGIELVQRNWLQVANSQAIFAIGRIIEPGDRDFKGFVNHSGKQIVAGGTGWAVEMSIQRGKPTYVFDMRINDWLMWWHDLNEFIRNPIPHLTLDFAGIGSREITPEGLQAIRDVYTQTFKNQ